MSLFRVIGYLWAAPNTLFGLVVGWILGGTFQSVDGVIEIHGTRIQKCLKSLPVPASAMTMGHVVFGQDQVALEMTRAHERVHVRQYAIWGPFFLPAYLGVSLALYAIRRDGYRENPFEVQAYAVDDPASRPWPNRDSIAPQSTGVCDRTMTGQHRWRNLRWLLPILIVVGCVLAIRLGTDELISIRRSLGVYAPILTVGVHAVVAAAPVPSDVIVIVNGAVYPFYTAVVLSWLGWFLGAILEFQTVRFITGVDNIDDARAKMPTWLQSFPADSGWFLILGRQIPGVGAHLTAVTAAATGVGLGRYLFYTAIAIVPGAILLTAIGQKLT